MPAYYMLLDAMFFHTQAVPALAESWRRRSFLPCRELCEHLVPRASRLAGREWLADAEPLLARMAAGLAFDRDLWRLLVGEILLYGAAEVPEIQTAPETLLHLLAPEHRRKNPRPREKFLPIEQAHWGTRDLCFGGAFYRPEQAGYNDREDVARLAAYLENVDPGGWSMADLVGLPDAETEEDRAEELAWARDWFPALCDLYGRARDRDLVVVYEGL